MRPRLTPNTALDPPWSPRGTKWPPLSCPPKLALIFYDLISGLNSEIIRARLIAVDTNEENVRFVFLIGVAPDRIEGEE